jgi:aspartate/methionine/tyrosine aminotransferase
VVATARRVSTHTAFNVSVAMQRAAIAALDDRAFPRTARDTYRAARDAVYAALVGAPVRCHLAEGATYAFVDLAPALKGRPLLALLEKAVDRGVLLAPGDAFGATYANFARLCFTSVPLPLVLSGVARLREAIEAL